jgi:hypothetical protein
MLNPIQFSHRERDERTLAWGFSTEPEFEERLGWTRREAARRDKFAHVREHVRA